MRTVVRTVQRRGDDHWRRFEGVSDVDPDLRRLWIGDGGRHKSAEASEPRSPSETALDQ